MVNGDDMILTEIFWFVLDALHFFNQLQFFVAKKVGKIVFCTFGMLETSWRVFFASELLPREIQCLE